MVAQQVVYTNQQPVTYQHQQQQQQYHQQPHHEQHQQHNQQPQHHHADPYAPQQGSQKYGPRFTFMGAWKNPFWALLFIGHLIADFVIASQYGPAMIDDIKSNTNKNSSGKSLPDYNYITLLVGAACIAVAISFLWLNTIRKYARSIIKISIWFNIAVLGVALVASFAYGLVAMGIVYLLLLIITIFWYYAVQDYIEFTHAMLDTSTNAIQDHTATIWVTLILAIVQVGWIAFWAFTFSSVYHHLNKYDSTSSGTAKFVTFYLLLSLYWTAQVLRNISHTTTASVVGAYWFQPELPNPTWSSFKRCCTTSLGSIAFGSFLVAFIQTLRAMLRFGRDKSRDFARECADCLLSMIEQFIAFLNYWAYTFIAIYGMDFTTAASSAWELITSRTFDLLVNDDLTQTLITFSCIMIGAISGLIIGGIASASNLDGWLYIGILAFVIGLVISMLVLSVVESAVATTFVCWAEDPHALNSNRPSEFHQIQAASRRKYGDRYIYVSSF